MKRSARLVLSVAVLAAVAVGIAMTGTAAAPAGSPVWIGGHNPLAPTVYAQSEPVQEPVPSDPEPVQEPVQEPVEESQPESPAEEVEESQPEVEPEPEPEPEVVEPEPEPEPVTLSDVYGALQSAVTAEAAHQVTVGASTDALDAARQGLVDAEQSHASAMEDQGEHNAGIRARAQAVVDFLTAAYLQ